MFQPILLAENLRARLEAQHVPAGAHFTLGDPAVDARLGSGLKRAALHELFAAEEEDAAAAAGFALMLALLGSAPDQPLVWIREDRSARYQGALHAPGLLELGADPGRFLLVVVEDGRTLLRAADDVVRSGIAGAVVIEPDGRAPLFDLTASRRLSLSAARIGRPAIVLRARADPMPSAAQTRWRVASAPSTALPADAPGHPAIDITLLRHRGGIAGFTARLEWNRDLRSFAPLSGGLSAAAPVRTDPARPVIRYAA